MMEKPHEIFPKDPRKTYGLMEMVRGTTPMADTGVEDTVMSWPHLVVMEAIAILSISLLMLVISVVANAPLREIANPDVTENPAKAPWYFLNLQELLLHMNPSLAGVIIPTIVIAALMAIPYLDRDPRDMGIWFASKKGRVICLWSALYTAVVLVALIIFDEFVSVRHLISEPEVVPGWVIPLLVMGILMGVLRLGIQRWRPSTREVVLALFTAFVITYIILTLSGTFFRGYGMHLTLPWALPPGSVPL